MPTNVSERQRTSVNTNGKTVGVRRRSLSFADVRWLELLDTIATLTERFN
jgi:hypothetical protein